MSAAANLGELLDAAALLASQPVPAGGRVAVVSNTRGGAVLAVDACRDAGLQSPGWPGRPRGRCGRCSPTRPRWPGRRYHRAGHPRRLPSMPIAAAVMDQVEAVG